jgi:hypothetical protein
MRKMLLGLIAAGAFVVPALADQMSLDVINKTGQAIKTITAVPRAGGSAINLSAEEIAVGATSTLTFDGPASTCVFTVSSTLASGKVITLSDVFLCHTQSLVIQ